MFKIEKRYVDEMVAHAVAEKPNECCGILAGVDGRIAKLYRTTNIEASPYRYNVHPKELLQILDEIDSNEWQFSGIYHSHTFSEAYPSPTDVSLAFWPEALYFLISLADPHNPVVRAFHIVDGKVTEEQLQVSE
jgi:proteasome lid subunit RPN8/RPN11